ncbi:MAG: HIT domain-containing protein [Rhodospirillales bacterium]
MFELHPRLREDGIDLGRFALCRLLLMNDATYPWFILVPERRDVREVHDLSDADQHLLIDESSRLARWLGEAYRADKINVAALGNMVPQLHWHVIVRYRTDPAWPAPVWGRGPSRPYSPEQIAAVRERLRGGFADRLAPID